MNCIVHHPFTAENAILMAVALLDEEIRSPLAKSRKRQKLTLQTGGSYGSPYLCEFSTKRMRSL